jgi:transitional endoplasmic reticulum ATPase
MSESVRALRPQIDVFQRKGWRLTIVDTPLILAAADDPVEVFRGAVFPSPVRQVRMSVVAGVRDGQPVFVLEATVHSGRGPRARPRFAVLGDDPIGALLARRAGAGDPRAVRVVDGLETAVGEVFRRLGMPPPTPPEPSWEQGQLLRSEIVIDDRTGLRTTVTHHALSGASRTDDSRIITLRAAVAAEAMTAGHLAALFEVMVDVADDLSGRHGGGRRPGTQHTFVISRHPHGESAARTVAGGMEAGGTDAAGAEAARTEPERVTLDQVGGLDDIVAQFREIAVSFRHPQAMQRWGARRPQGIVLYGPPGTGKTMLARALANEIGGTLREIRTPDILDKWLGASERNMRRIFLQARRYRVPTVMLFDEFDSIISYAGAGVDSGSHAVNAVAGIFKQEMTNLVEKNPNVIVVATTNVPHLIDDSLIRSGRFDIKLEIPMPGAVGRAQIITRMIRGLVVAHEVSGFQMFADDIDVAELADLSEGMAGADLKEVLRRAQMMKAMQEARTGVHAAPIGHVDLRDRIGELRQALSARVGAARVG